MPLDPRAVEEIRRANVAHNVALIRKAAKQGAQIVCLGELFPAPYFAIDEFDPKWVQFAEEVEGGETVEEIQNISSELAMIVIAPIYEHDRKNKRHYNTAVVIQNGKVLGISRKTHIPFGKNEQGRFTEATYYTDCDDDRGHEGRVYPVFETKAGKVGVATCYARHFNEAWEELKQNGAQLVFSPSITFGDVSERAWELEYPTEALRKGMFIGGSNRRGQEFEGGPVFFGKTYFVGPNGKKLPSISDDENLVIADLDTEQLTRDPSGWNLVQNSRGKEGHITRRDVYAKHAGRP